MYLEFNEYCEIAISKLANIRANEAFKKHEDFFFSSIANNNAIETDRQLPEIYSMMPPRSIWPNPNEHFRNVSNVTTINEWRIVKAIENSWGDHNLRWFSLLYEFLVSSYNLYSSGFISNPKFCFIPKDKSKNLWRPITLYSLSDRMNSSLWAKDLLSIVDKDADSSLLADSGVVFRNNWYREETGLNKHHSVFELIIRYWKQHYYKSGRPIYIAEADIKGFYDNVNKNVIRNWFAAKNLLMPIYLTNYLDSYNFYEMLLGESEKVSKPVKNYKADMQSLDPNFDPLNYGIAQGGALSCVLANIVFEPVDKAIEALASGTDLIYLRYCDDMILMSVDRDLVSAATDTYYKVCKDLFIPVHPAVNVSSYNKDFWAAKSKLPYKWASPVDDGMPWLSFLGYQMRYDGILRMRPGSLAKEMNAQKEIVDKVLDRLHRSSLSNEEIVKKSGERLINKIENRLYKRVTGYCKVNTSKAEGFSWNKGFELLVKYPCVENQFKLLDRKKNKQINRLVKKGFKRPSFRTSYFNTMKIKRSNYLISKDAEINDAKSNL